MKTKAEAAANPQPGDRWLRSHDALIAERAEGLRVWQGVYGEYWVDTETGHRPLDRYREDLAAIARAMEAWRGQEPDYRAWAIESHEGQIDAECRDWNRRYWGHSENGDIPHACAAALLRALGGGE